MGLVHFCYSNLLHYIKLVDFLKLFLTHVHGLLREQEDANMKTDWVKVDAAKASNMKKSETLRYEYNLNVLAMATCLI